jgi:hypothetical protein
VRGTLLQADLERSCVFMDSTVSESSKAEIILAEIRFLPPAEFDSLRANAEELKKDPDQVSPLPCFAVLESFHENTPFLP